MNLGIVNCISERKLFQNVDFVVFCEFRKTHSISSGSCLPYKSTLTLMLVLTQQWVKLSQPEPSGWRQHSADIFVRGENVWSPRSYFLILLYAYQSSVFRKGLTSGLKQAILTTSQPIFLTLPQGERSNNLSTIKFHRVLITTTQEIDILPIKEEKMTKNKNTGNNLSMYSTKCKGTEVIDHLYLSVHLKYIKMVVIFLSRITISNCSYY